MATKNNTYRIGSRLLGLIVLTFFLISTILHSQTNSDQHVKLTENAVKNVISGIQSDNDGLKMSCIYYAGKYKIVGVSKELVEVMKTSENDELCKMLVWSIYEIGNESCCKELLAIVKNHPSDQLRDFYSNLHNIKEFESVIADN